MGKFLSSGFLGFLCSIRATGEKDGKGRNIMIEDFQSGFNGWGWKIWSHFVGRDAEGNIRKRYKMSIDDMEVRGTMTIFELLIQKIRALKGYLGITQGNGQVKTVESDENNFYLKMEDENSFLKDDFIRCQRFDKTGKGKGYWVKVADIDGQDRVVIPKTEFTVIEGEIDEVNIPAPGDEIVQFGNETDSKRQSAIFLHVDSDGNPAIDIMFGISTKSFEGCTKVRLGGSLPREENKFQGLYCENGIIKSVTNGNTMYILRPDGTAEFGAGSTIFKPDKSGHIAGGAIAWRWDDDRRAYICDLENVVLKWKSLEEIPGWITDLTRTATQIGDNYVISPQMFSGTLKDGKPYNGIAFGNDIITVTEGNATYSKSGLFGIKEGKVTFSLDLSGELELPKDLIARVINAEGLNIADRFVFDKDSKDLKLGNLTILESGALAGGNAVYDNIDFFANNTDNFENYIINNIGKSTTFVLYPILNLPSGTKVVYLPSADELLEKGIPPNFGFRLTLIVAGEFVYHDFETGTTNTVPNNVIFKITGKTKGVLRDNSFNNMEFVNMAQGDTLQLYYYGGNYYLIGWNH